LTFSDNATLRQEFVKCGKVECKCSDGEQIHGPYIYAYWKDNGKLRKKYIGKSIEDHEDRESILKYTAGLGMGSKRETVTYMRRFTFIDNEVKKGNNFAKEYQDKLRESKVTMEQGYRMINENIKLKRLMKIFKIAKEQGFDINSDNYIDFIAQYMKDNGLKTINELDSYINMEFR
jgi:hypothetical protein